MTITTILNISKTVTAKIKKKNVNRFRHSTRYNELWLSGKLSNGFLTKFLVEFLGVYKLLGRLEYVYFASNWSMRFDKLTSSFFALPDGELASFV
jgi:hypothetical protein